MSIVIKNRTRNDRLFKLALETGVSPLLAHIVACRLTEFAGDINSIIKPGLKYIDRPALLKDSDKAAARIARAIMAAERIGIATDYDVDGVTSHAVIQRALTEYFRFPAPRIDNLIGHRVKDGYGISEGLTARILAQPELPAVIITADCGSSDNPRIARLKAAGIDVIVTDHHAMPLEGIPAAAYAVINPSRQDCHYPDDTIAGCMTAWLLMSHVRNKLIDLGYLPPDSPKLARELDYVSLGTVADCVSIGTATNRAVVTIGLNYLNRFERPCWRAMRTLLDKKNHPFNAEDLGFQIGPRINARSRMADPYAALKYLLADDDQAAMDYLSILDVDNRDRRKTERQMVETASQEAYQQVLQGRSSLVIYLQDGHAGVQGIVASRLAQSFGRPTVVLCNASDPEQLTGSSRSIPSLHIRDALQQVADWQPGLFIKFGGHQGAAGFTVYRSGLTVLHELFERAVTLQLGNTELAPTLWTDGILATEAISLKTFEELEQLQPYGREFEAPVFENTFEVISLRAVGAEAIHLSLALRAADGIYKAIWFRALEAESDPYPLTPGDTARCAFSLALNEFRGARTLNLVIQHACKA